MTAKKDPKDKKYGTEVMNDEKYRKPFEDIGLILANKRKGLGWKCRDVAERVGVSDGAISAYENASTRISEPRLRSLCGALGLNPEPLVNMLPNKGRGIRTVAGSGRRKESDHRSLPFQPLDQPLTFGGRVDLLRKAREGMTKADWQKLVAVVDLVVED